jgi:histidinol-phosphate aminotransferase
MIKSSTRVRGLPSYKPGKPIEELQRELGFEKVTKLASNESPIGPSPLVIAELEKLTRQAHLYPDGDCFELKKRLAFKEEILPNQIIIGNGSNEVLELVAHAYLEEGDEALMGEHCFIVYPIVSSLSRATVVRSSMENMAIDLTDLLARITEKTKVIFLANPNNPTGTRSTKKEIEVFLDEVPKNILVVLDEAYSEYMSPDDVLNVCEDINKHKNLLVLKTFSKAYGLAGLRVGYGMADSTIIETLNKPREPFNVNSMAQAAAIRALEDSEHIARAVSINKEGMIYLKSELNKLNIKTYPSYANFLLLEFKSNARTLYEELLKVGIITRPLENYGLMNHLRVTIGTEENNLQFIAELKKLI